jgi:hypothetical protein
MKFKILQIKGLASSKRKYLSKVVNLDLCNKKPWNKLEACGEICCVHGGPNSGVRA